jgi:hypothetical protein
MSGSGSKAKNASGDSTELTVLGTKADSSLKKPGSE